MPCGTATPMNQWLFSKAYPIEVDDPLLEKKTNKEQFSALDLAAHRMQIKIHSQLMRKESARVW